MPQSDSSNRAVWILAIVGVVGVLAVVALPLAFFAYLFWMFSPGGGFGPLPAGLEVSEPAPALVAEGWINGPAPTEETLEGKVVLVEAWASW